jgi:hypothetical protein
MSTRIIICMIKRTKSNWNGMVLILAISLQIAAVAMVSAALPPPPCPTSFEVTASCSSPSTPSSGGIASNFCKLCIPASLPSTCQCGIQVASDATVTFQLGGGESSTLSLGVGLGMELMAWSVGTSRCVNLPILVNLPAPSTINLQFSVISNSCPGTTVAPTSVSIAIVPDSTPNDNDLIEQWQERNTFSLDNRLLAAVAKESSDVSALTLQEASDVAALTSSISSNVAALNSRIDGVVAKELQDVNSLQAQINSIQGRLNTLINVQLPALSTLLNTVNNRRWILAQEFIITHAVLVFSNTGSGTVGVIATCRPNWIATGCACDVNGGQEKTSVDIGGTFGRVADNGCACIYGSLAAARETVAQVSCVQLQQVG